MTVCQRRLHASPHIRRLAFEPLEHRRLLTVSYTVTEVGTLGGASSSARAINQEGEVVGGSELAPPSTLGHAFLYSNGAMTDLGSLGVGDSDASGINDNGQVVGVSDNSQEAFLYSDGVMTGLGNLGAFYSYAKAINNSGEVVGESEVLPSEALHAFLYSDGTMHDLGTLAGFRDSSATGINDGGEVVGYLAGAVDGPSHAFLYSNGTMEDLGTLGGATSEAAAINSNGQVVGWANTSDGDTHAFLYSNGVMQDLGALAGATWAEAFAINDNGQIVGESSTADNSTHAFLFANGAMVDLNSQIDPASGWILTQAYGINNAGQIVGYGTFNGKPASFLLSLDHPEVTTQPPPSIVSGQSFGMTVAVDDATGNIDSSYEGPVTVSLAGETFGSGTLTGLTTVQAVNGMATFNSLTLSGVGTFTLVVLGEHLTSSAPSSPIDSTGSAAIATQPPENILQDEPFGMTVVATGSDGKLDGNYSGPVTVALESTSGAAVLGGTTTVNAIHGVATFSNLMLIGGVGSASTFVATGVDLTASVPSNATSDEAQGQAVFTISPPSSVQANGPFSLTVAAEDAKGNIFSAYDGPVTITLASGANSGTLEGAVTVNAVNGVAVFDNLSLTGVGAFSLIASGADLGDSKPTGYVKVSLPSGYYAVTDVGSLAGNYNYMVAINDEGQIAGSEYSTGGDAHAFLYTDGLRQDLGTLGGANSYASGINGNGEVVGISNVVSGSYAEDAFLYADGVMHDLGSGEANAINDSGQVVGASGSQAFLYENGIFQRFGADSVAYGINAAGQVVGGSKVANGQFHAYLYVNGTVHDLGTLPGGTSSLAYGINATGQVTGLSQTASGNDHAILYSNGTMQDLGTLPGGTDSFGYAVNASSQVVGYADSNGYQDAFVYKDKSMADLNTLINPLSGWKLEVATGINDAGQIVGWGINTNAHDGELHAFLLTPVAASSSAGPPEVTDVVVDSTDWTTAFLNSLQTVGGTNFKGFSIPVGSSSQWSDLPWTSLNQIQVAFNENVNVQENSLEIAGLNVAQYTFANFSYDSITHTATWTLANPISADKLSLDLHSTGPDAVTDASDNSLDGEWTNGMSSYPSGDGTAGSDFDFSFNVLPGDISQTGVVNAQSIALVSSNWLSAGPAGDVNGDAIVNAQDLALISSNWLSTLPAESGGVAELAVAANSVSGASAPAAGASPANGTVGSFSNNDTQRSMGLAVGAAWVHSVSIDTAIVGSSGSALNALTSTPSTAILLSSGVANATTTISNENIGTRNGPRPTQSYDRLVAGSSQPPSGVTVPAPLLNNGMTGPSGLVSGCPMNAAGTLVPPTEPASNTSATKVPSSLANPAMTSPPLVESMLASFISPQPADRPATFLGGPNVAAEAPTVDHLMSQQLDEAAFGPLTWPAIARTGDAITRCSMRDSNGAGSSWQSELDESLVDDELVAVIAGHSPG